MTTEIESFHQFYANLLDALPCYRRRLLAALASPGLIGKTAAAPAMTTLVG